MAAPYLPLKGNAMIAGEVKEASFALDGLRKDGLIDGKAFDKPIDFAYFDLWHYYGRTAKHGAFMGGADFVQWHGFYELNLKLTELKRQAEELRATRRGESGSGSASGSGNGGEGRAKRSG